MGLRCGKCQEHMDSGDRVINHVCQKRDENTEQPAHSTAFLYGVGLDLRMCADGWDPDARLLGNIRAEDLRAMASDYVKLRLKEGIGS